MDKRKRMLLLVVVLMVAGLWSSAAWALRPMGPPMAGLEPSQMSVGFEFSWSEMDADIDGDTTDDIESLAYLANLGYGIADNWEAFIRLGIAGVDVDDEDFSGDDQFAYGFGTKLTFAEDDALTWGGLFQMDWTKSEDSGEDVEIEAYEIQIAVGPTYQMEGMSLFGGPFLHFVDGDVDVPGDTLDMEQESEIGGYVGAQFDIAENASWNIEFQFTGDAQAICTGIVWRF
jgi:hypothetical protein